MGDLGLARELTSSQPLACTMVGSPVYCARAFRGRTLRRESPTCVVSVISCKCSAFILSVGGKRFRQVSLVQQQRFPQHFSPELHEMRRLRPQRTVRQVILSGGEFIFQRYFRAHRNWQFSFTNQMLAQLDLLGYLFAETAP